MEVKWCKVSSVRTFLSKCQDYFCYPLLSLWRVFWDTLLIKSQQTDILRARVCCQNIWDSLGHHSSGFLYICSSETILQLIWQKMVSSAFLWEPQNCLIGKQFMRKCSSNAKQKQWFSCLGLKRAECLKLCVWIQDGVSPISNAGYHKSSWFCSLQDEMKRFPFFSLEISLWENCQFMSFSPSKIACGIFNPCNRTNIQKRGIDLNLVINHQY